MFTYIKSAGAIIVHEEFRDILFSGRTRKGVGRGGGLVHLRQSQSRVAISREGVQSIPSS